MIARVVLAVTCSVVGITLAQLKARGRNRDESREIPPVEEVYDGKEIYTYADVQQEEEEKVKRISSTFSPALSSRSFQEGDQLLLPEIDDLFQGGLDLPSDSEKSIGCAIKDTSKPKYESDDSFNSEDDEALEIFEALTSAKKLSIQTAKGNNESRDGSIELIQLKALVDDLKQKEIKLEAELLDYYGLKEQEKAHLELERQLRKKNAEIEKLNAKLFALEEQKQKLSEEVLGKENLKKELDVARAKVKDLQKTIQSDAGQTKAQLLILKQQVAILQEKEQEVSKKDFDTEKKLQTLRELEVEVLELRRTSKELQHQKRELTVQLAAAEAKIAELSSLTETELVARAQAETLSLKLVNDDLSKQVEGLQMNRFSEVEELVYLRWVNACLRYELRNYQAPPGKLSALELGKNLSPRSQEKAKQLMMEYAAPDLLAAKAREQTENDADSMISSAPSTPSEYDFDEGSIDGSQRSTRQSTSKKSGLIKKLKKWGRNKDEFHSSPASSTLSSPAYRPKGPLESLMMRNNSDSVAITTYGKNESDSGRFSTDLDDSMEMLRPVKTRQTIDRKDPISDVAASFQLMEKSVAGVLEDKYPAFKDRHKLAVARENAIKEKADQARAEKLAEKLKIAPLPPSLAPSPPMKLAMMATPGKISNKFKIPQPSADVIRSIEQNVERPEVQKMKFSEVEKRPTRVAKPPPKASAAKPPSIKGPSDLVAGIPPPPPPPPRAPGGPPPPPPPPGSNKLQASNEDKVQRAPELVEFYQSLMRREARKDPVLGGSDVNVSDARNNLIGEIENRSAFLLAVKADVETQGEFVESLAAEVRSAAYADIEDVVSFVSWLDEELSFLVDERAVLKHFDWPESKADVLREASFEYQDLKKLEIEATSFKDDPRLPCEAALKKMLSLLEKVEQSVYALLRTRDMAIARYKEFSIPTQWMLDSGLVGKIKLATVQLARNYMKRVAGELDASIASAVQDPQREFLLLQGVRFAFRVHQFAGGFDAESMRAFEELRDRVREQSSGTAVTANEAP